MLQSSQFIDVSALDSLQFTPAIDSLNKKNTLAETTANKIPQRSKPSFGAKSEHRTISPTFIGPFPYYAKFRFW
jgi:hypothetical protein